MPRNIAYGMAVKSEISPQKRNAMRDVVLIARPDMRRILTGGWELAGNANGAAVKLAPAIYLDCTSTPSAIFMVRPT